MLDQHVWREIANLQDDSLSELATSLLIQRAIHLPTGTSEFEYLSGPLLILAPADAFARWAVYLRRVSVRASDRSARQAQLNSFPSQAVSTVHASQTLQPIYHRQDWGEMTALV